LPELYLNSCWKPNLSITGADGLPAIAGAGNVLRPKTVVRLSMRLGPAFDITKVEGIFKKLLLPNPPYNAKVELLDFFCGSGWCMKEIDNWLNESI